MEHSQNADRDPFEESPLSPTRIGLLAAVFDVVAFSAVGHFALDDVAIGAATGLVLGLGVFLFLPVIIQSGEGGDWEAMAPADDPGPLRSFHRFAAGFACAATALSFFALMFADMELLVGIPAALVAGAVVYLGAGFALPNAKPSY